MATLPANGHGDGTRPGLLLRYADSSAAFKDSDLELLELRLELKIGEDKVKKIELAPDKMEAYVELHDVADIPKVISSGLSLKYKPPLIMEEFDLLQVWCPYLIAKGFEFEDDFAEEMKDILKDHFEATSKVESIELSGTEAKISFVHPQAALKFPPSDELLGFTLSLEVGYSTPAEQKRMVLAVRGLPSKLSEKMCKHSLVNYFSKHSGFKAAECRIIDSVGYLSFEDRLAVKAIISNPPTANFYRGTSLELSAAPISAMLHTDESGVIESQSAAFMRTYSSASESTMSPSSSMDSNLLRKGIGSMTSPSSSIDRRKKLEDTSLMSLDSLTGENQTAVMDEADFEDSLFNTQRSRNSSTSSESDGGMLRRDRQSSFGLDTVPENPISEIQSGKNPVSFTISDPSDDKTEVSDGLTKVLIANVPPQKRDPFVIECYLFRLVSIECAVTQYGELFMAIFHQPIDFQKLKDNSCIKPLESCNLCFYPLNPTSIILVTTDNESFLNQHLLKMHFETFAKSSVKEVKIVLPDKAYISFADSESVERAMANHECHKIGKDPLPMIEYYDFMENQEGDHKCNEIDNNLDAEEAAPSQEVELSPEPDEKLYNWASLNIEICDDIKDFWQDYHLRDLNGNLGVVNAHASLSIDQVESLHLKINPLCGSEKMPDWEEQVEKAVNKFHLHFKNKSLHIPDYGSADLIKYAESAQSTKVRVMVANNVLTLAGEADAVDEIVDTIKDKIFQLNEVKPEQRSFPRKHIKYLERFSARQLTNAGIPAISFTFDSDGETITIEAKQETRETFWAVIEAEIRDMREKKISLDFAAFQLLATKRGYNEIQEVIAQTPVVFDLADAAPKYELWLLSPQYVTKDKMKSIKSLIAKLIDSRVMKIDSPQKFVFCKDVKWKEFIDDIQNNVFVLVTVDEANQSIKVTGELVVVNSVLPLIEQYITDQTSIKEHILIDRSKWIVISQNFWHDLEAIKQKFQGAVDIQTPLPIAEVQAANAIVAVKGDPPMVDKAKDEIEALAKRVYEKEETLTNIPSVLLMVDSLEDKVRALEGKFRASIDVTVKKDESVSSPTTSQAVALKLCSATCDNEVRISVFGGDFTSHNKVDAIINFIQPTPTYKEDSLKLMFAEGGCSLQDDFKRKLSQFLKPSPGEIFISDSGQLQCGKLCHCIVPLWDGKVVGDLKTALSKTLHIIKRCSTILFTSSICSDPLNYPAETFAESILDLIPSAPDISSDLTIAVYVDKVAHAAKFESQFQKSNCRISTKVEPSATLPKQPRISRARSIQNPISSYITLTKGDLLETKADVYINSTNSTLDLKTGTLSNLLLKACGDELQQECSKHAPLKPEVVAITEVDKVKAKYLYHIALPDYKQDFHASRKFRGTIKAILRTAKDEGVQSLAFPSLGVGNLNYPAETSAKILFEEIVAFHERNRTCNMEFHFVIFDQPAYLEFSKEYARKMNSMQPKTESSSKKSGGIKGSGGSTRLSVECADISEEETEIIVNTTSQDMKLSNSAVSKALLMKAGAILQDTCDQLVQSGLKLDHGQIVVTKSYGTLQCKKIIHAHLPSRGELKTESRDHVPIIKEIVKKCLDKAEGLSMKSISFPAFGFGQGGYSVHEVAEPMLTAFKSFGRQNPKSVQIIRIVIFDKKLHKEFFDFFTNFFKVDTSIPQKLVNTVRSKLSPKSGNGEWSVELQNADLTPIHQPHSQEAEVDSKSLLSFKIFADSKEKCDKIASVLRSSVKEKCIDDKIEKPKKVITNLIEADIEDIKRIGTAQQVQVKVLADLGKIEISGEMSRVKEAKIQIMDTISECEKSESELKIYKWSWEEDDGSVEDYSFDDSFKLERARARNLLHLEMIVDDSVEVIIDLEKMKEISKVTGTARKIDRVLINPSLKFPDTWESQPFDANGKEVPMHMFDVPESSPEYKEVLDRFSETTPLSNVTIVSLKRVQNPNEYRKHMAFSEAISRKYSHQKKKIDIRRLFHGCAQTVIEPIATQGFNRNFAASSNAAYYGPGVYFALNSSYSAQPKYSVPNKADGHQSMFVCQVIIGEYTVGNKNMKTAPTLAEGSSEVYDTLVERKDNPTIFVAMTDAQAYPEYLLTFKKNK